ncbi:16S rRNA (cytosine(1402)-N(4))-methyltransferase RsmH [Candidatus Aquiluna sp. UB-MaderosW2red]|uniref:16S rRNA (cytosine(1402)-N(4))-methyltransferase RsmH n=1 Tax=Candidatus Aquiluna sp. UB-MaderosW2red TaxID=1855377 RepID=UPI000875D1A0|nr:16S rRNA (cytosine(1402)-N(4))-methyltransferase RsmH [Candidatus Aquiluna sp. UB-MaderosW2red]SCX12700.1 16S rRNA (cytosine1402-N4)-methyltransferase [Candidatus Aquiluna sp. UB-MaderosW2red]
MNQSTSDLHTPVLLERCLELLAPSVSGDNSIVIDCTLGLGGHSQALLEAHPTLRVIGIDRDPRAIELASERLSAFGARFSAHLAVYDQILDVLAELGISKVNGVLMDLGVSSMQLDEAGRGFSYAKDAVLDMRMDQSSGRTAAEILARYSEEELTHIFKKFGEERFSGPIAKRIVQDRKLAPIETSSQLNKIVTQIVPSAPGKTTGHPAKRIYQALRIAANDELGALERSLPQAIEVLAPMGRIVVMSYHSLEDGIVKQALQAGSVSSTPIDLPFELPGTGAILKIITKGVERAGEIELSANPRAASARLRAAEKLEVKE